VTHINPDGKAVGGSQPTEMALLHIYSQPCEHFEARIVGNLAGLQELKGAIERVLTWRDRNEAKTNEVFATDGEGYQVIVIRFPDDWKDPKWNESPPHYCDRGYADDTHPGG